ncbi:MAG: DUF2062 domain-containing protein [Pseudomonadota bacterium]
MLFARRKKPDWREALRVAAWPRRSWSRSMAYIRKRTCRIAASPHEIALGFAIGAFMSFTPWLGVHIAAGCALAWLFGVSMLASALGTIVGNPITFPFIWAASVGLGNLLLGRAEEFKPAKGAEDQMLRAIESGYDYDRISSVFRGIWEPIIKPMLVGGTPLGLVTAAICYVLIRKFVAVVQTRRRAQLQARAAAIAAE